VEPLAQAFGHCHEKFSAAARELSRAPTALATVDLKFQIPALPKVPVVCILRLGDDAVNGSAQVPFDETADRQVNFEDLAAAGEFAAYLLTRAAGFEGGTVGKIFLYR